MSRDRGLSFVRAWPALLVRWNVTRTPAPATPRTRSSSAPTSPAERGGSGTHLRQSDLGLIDHLVNPEVLVHARPGVEIRSVGKRSGRHSLTQTEINRLLIEVARAGRVVARLKGGDPFVFGRGGEEAEALGAAGIAWEVVPGISAGIAAAAYAGIPVLHRERASSMAFVSGHPGCDPGKVALEADTLVVFMCGSTIAGIARTLLARGRPRWMPVALICSGTTACQVVYTGALGELARLDSLDIPTPVIAVVGEVAALAAKLHWFGPPRLPLRAAPRREPARTAS